MVTALSKVAEAVETGRLEYALEVALTAWRETPAPEIAAAVERLDRRVRERVPGPKGRTKIAFHEAWMALSKDRSAVATGWLAATLQTKVQMTALVRNLHLRQRLEQLAQRPGDPRIATAVFTLIEKGKISIDPGWELTARDPIYGHGLEILTAQQDPRQADALQRLLAEPRAATVRVRTYLSMHAPAVVRALREVARDRLAAAEHHGWATIAPGEASPSGRVRPRRLQELLWAIRERPCDDELRLVYADLLQEAGDSRGRFIALQMAEAGGAATAAMAKRARQLLREHQRQWLGGPLSTVLKKIRFRRGFLESATLRRDAEADISVWADAAKDPRLRTLRSLERGNASAGTYLTLIQATPHIDTVEAPDDRSIRALARMPGPRRHRRLTCSAPPSASALGVVGTSEAFAHLKCLDVTTTAETEDQVARALTTSGVLARVAELSLLRVAREGAIGRADFGLRLWPRLPTTVQALSHDHVRMQASIIRTADGACFVELDMDGAAPGMERDLVPALPSETTLVTLKNGHNALVVRVCQLVERLRPDVTVEVVARSP